VEIQQYPGDKAACRNIIALKHHIADDEKIIQFNGLLSYKPNLDALKAILDKINPLLLAQPSFKYKLIVCGKGLPEEMNLLKEYAGKNIIFTGFTPDIITYFKATDIFLNPVQGGGGIKTKMVEAIAFGATVIATKTGATGMDRAASANKLFVVADNDWDSFAAAILQQAAIVSVTPASYYDVYYWGSIVRKAIIALRQ
jgi:glycosyltransferase involved in cell wall biosynthesis